ncbi:MAG TPA: phosphatase PAP2 family protein [Paludibacteraceae bacterium]|nr:phosphatase PAP2 family protein [Paludibacteraceae bacterium]HPT42726.1 phosphatase PAP2 family protein [Paludibacteraceae bacterium]
MRKITTIILLCCAFLITCTDISAQNTDIELLKSFNQNESVLLRNYSKVASNTTVYLVLAAPLTLGTISLIEKNDDLLKDAIYICSATALDGIITYSMKKAIHRQRPYVSFPNEVTAYATENSFSMPSGHTSLAFTTATALSLSYPKWYVIAPGYIWACSIGYSRMNLGVHYPSDVLAGAVLGAGSAFVTYKINQWYWKKREKKKLIGLENFENL